MGMYIDPYGLSEKIMRMTDNLFILFQTPIKKNPHKVFR